MDFTERLIERNRSRQAKHDAKDVLLSTEPLKQVNQNIVTTVASTSVNIKKNYSGSNKVTIETTVTMSKHPPKRMSNQKEDLGNAEDTASTEVDESSDDKENESSQNVNSVLRQDTKSRLKRLGVLYSDDPSRLSSPIHKTEECFFIEEPKEEEPKAMARNDIRSSGRSARLAALADTINHWEDDPRHIPLKKPSPTKSSVMTKHSIHTNKKEDQEHRKFISCQKGRGESSEPYGSPPKNLNNITTRFRRQKTPERAIPSILKHNSEIRSSPQHRSAKNTKSIVWDKSVIDVLEAQGFSSSGTSQKFEYDYERPGPSPTRSSPSRSLSPQKSPVKTPSVSPQKSPFRTPSVSPQKSPVKSSPVKERFGSPVKMGTSDVKTRGLIPHSSEVEPSPPTMGVKQLRSPRKVTSTPPSGSVLDRAQRYEEATSPTKRARDPAELSLAERRALFERNAGSAVLPRAPFAMAVPASKLQQSRSDNGVEKTTKPAIQVSSGSLHNRVAAFERVDNSRGKNHIKETLSERQKELEMLRHRWDRRKGLATEKSDNFKPSAPPLSPPPLPSPPQTFEYGSRRNSSFYEPEGEYPEQNTSPELAKPEEAYPVLKEVKKIKLSPPKPGHLYPNLSDMEAESSEAPECDLESTTSTNHNNRSTSTDMSDESDLHSLGQDIVKLSRSSLKMGKLIDCVTTPMPFFEGQGKVFGLTTRDWSASEGSRSEAEGHEIDDFLDEALDNSMDESTPPKRTSYSNNAGSVQSRSFEYSQNNQQEDSKQPLLHTVSLYRKQQNMALKPPSPTRHVRIDPSEYSSDDSIERMEEELDRELKQVEQKIALLQQEVIKQQTYISQASQALNFCYSTIEFSGSTEQVEAEKLLLLASQRRQAVLHEIQRLRVEQTLRPRSTAESGLTERGSLTLSNITLPLKLDVIHRAAKDDQCFYLVCLVHHNEQVLGTNVMCAPRHLREHNRITFPDTLTLKNLYSDFKVTVEVYSMTARNKDLIPHDVKYHINTSKKEASKLKLTPRKGKGESRLVAPAVQSPGGPSAVRSSAFSLAGYVIFSLREINRNQFTLNKNTYTSVVEGSLQLRIETEMSVDVEYRGFLTMFEDVSGFGAWHRRWCLLKGDTLSYWKYPDDERKKVPLDTIELTMCITREVDIVPRDVCARPNTFLLETSRPARDTDTNSLVMIRKGNRTTIRHLLSADTKEDRIQWCQHLNKALALMRAWGVSAKN